MYSGRPVIKLVIKLKKAVEIMKRRGENNKAEKIFLTVPDSNLAPILDRYCQEYMNTKLT